MRSAKYSILHSVDFTVPARPNGITMEVLPLIRVVGLGGSSCEIRLTEGVEQKSSVLATMAGEWRAADDPGVMALDLRLSTCSRVVPSASVVCRFLDHLSGADAATPHALLSHTEGLLEVATFLGIETIDIFHEERWIGNRSDRLAQHARMQLARRETALLFAGTLVNAWFKTELRTAPHICFIFMQAPPNEHYPNTLASGVDGQPFEYGLSAPFRAIPVVVGGRRPPSSTPPSAAEGTLPDQQRRLMNDLYQTCAVPEGRDLLVRMLSNLSYYVITRPLEKLRYKGHFGIDKYSATAFFVSRDPLDADHVRAPPGGDNNRGRRAHEQGRRHPRQGRSRSRDRGGSPHPSA